MIASPLAAPASDEIVSARLSILLDSAAAGAADDAGAALDPAAVVDPHAVSESAVIDASTRANNFFFMLILLFNFSLGCRILIYPAAIGYCLSLVRILANTHISVNSLSC